MSVLNMMTALSFLDSAITMRLGKNKVALKLACWGHWVEATSEKLVESMTKHCQAVFDSIMEIEQVDA